MKHTPREHERLHLTFALRVFEGERFVGFMADIAENGIMIISDAPFTEGVSSRLRMKPPSSFSWKGTAGPNHSIEFSARCKWTQKSETDENYYISGFEYTDIRAEEKDVIHSLIQKYHMK